MPPYSPASVEIFGKPAGPIRLYDTGDFYKGFFVRIESGKAVFSSSDQKTGLLTREYGSEIFGLDKGNIKELSREYILPDLQEFVRNQIKGN